jgi:hypothetical protein
MMNRKLIILAFCVFEISCGSKTSTPQNNQYAGPTAANVMTVVVGNCGPNGYANEPCVSVKICSPGTQNCQVIPNILLDTGSYGLRLFSSVLTIPLTQVLDEKQNPIAQCAQFGTSNTWGSVQLADVVLSGEPAVQVPIQVIDANFKNLPASCVKPDTTPAVAGYNGILGVGVLTYDCGQDCVDQDSLGIYFSCVSSSCTSASLPLSKQIANPVSRLPVDNNGVILELPQVPDSGVVSLRGTLTIGIDTQTNNVSAGSKLFQADQFGNFQSSLGGTTYSQSFIDSGSNGLFFPQPKDMPLCHSAAQQGFYCPASPKSLVATQISSDGKMKVDVAFQVVNADTAINDFGPAVGAFSNLAGTQGSSIDWGLPFFFGRRVVVGLELKSSTLGKGPYWAW